MTEEEFKAGFQCLSDLSEQEYHKSLSECITKSPKDQHGYQYHLGSPFYSVGRLIGVSVKEPFATVEILARPSSHSGSYRSWHLHTSTLEGPSQRQTWQYRTLNAICSELRQEGANPSVLQLAEYATHETGFFGYLARSAAKYICDDAELRKKINKNVAKAKVAGFNAKHLRPEVLVQAGGFALGSLLVDHIPVFRYVGPPVIAGFVLVLYSIGADAFCSYVHGYIHDKTQTGPRSDEMDFSTGGLRPERKPPWKQKDP